MRIPPRYILPLPQKVLRLVVKERGSVFNYPLKAKRLCLSPTIIRPKGLVVSPRNALSNRGAGEVLLGSPRKGISALLQLNKTKCPPVRKHRRRTLRTPRDFTPPRSTAPPPRVILRYLPIKLVVYPPIARMDITDRTWRTCLPRLLNGTLNVW